MRIPALAGATRLLHSLKAPTAWLLGLWLLAGVFATPPALAQDTVSTADIQFTPVQEAAPTAKAADTATAGPVASPATNSDAKAGPAPTAKASQPAAAQTSLWVTFLAGLLGGFAAVLMPCIFPLLPMTVSFFTKRSGTRARGIRNALVYGASIIVIYVALGLLITVLFGADALNNLATNGIFNFFFFLLLLVFGASFLGAFEIMLPTAWANKMDEKADKGGLLGIFFMAATLALVSFSCTGPIIGTLLVQAASMGQLLGPAVGMFGFALALAMPFTLFSLFPGWMASLPKSGGWLNSVKVTLGFLELALALKFLSNVDLAYHWQWFDREVYLVLWVVIFGMMGLYLLGKLRFSHDSDLAYITLPRLFLSIIVLAFTLYLVPGLWGAPLRAVSAFLPPQDTQDFDLYTPSLLAPAVGSGAAPASTAPHKYADLFHAPLGLPAFFDYDEGMAYARQVGKPVLIDFTGHACVNCRKMEANVWPDKQVLPLIRDKYVLIQLYVDDKTELPAAEQTVSKFSGKTIRTIGNKYSDLQASRFNTNSQPYYVLLGRDGQVLVPPQGADYEVADFVKYLDSGLKAYR
ncbi:thioredoxin family protein [Hymenobacter sp. BRD128]|uniref:protein-disulfide reductase DsbD family protein n=1 Tax=Hymenobacter sp. BRD128 TaxID=2675878 RepID=UPI0015645A8E|nr:thioredoxin family protein [Hymenobacter sp. BRD128]QKG55520.1 thioredoxin family protein [Hymenobacter sp. BRD128]